MREASIIAWGTILFGLALYRVVPSWPWYFRWAAALLAGVIVLFLWDTWRGRREERDMRKRFEAEDQS